MVKNLRDILYKSGILEVIGQTDQLINGITADSRQVEPGNIFVAQTGLQADGHQFINAALDAGAKAVVCEQMPDKIPENISFIRVKDTSASLGIMAANFFGNPSGKLKLIGVTGTNGKTSVVTLLYHLFTDLGFPCGMLSTIQNLIAGNQSPATHTTPDPVRLNQLLSEMVDAGCEYAFMEVSSHAVVQKRIAGLCFIGAVFTNLSHDHIDYHQTFRDYLLAKKTFFDSLDKNAFALINLDDKNGMVMVQNCPAKMVQYGLKTAADYSAKILENNLAGMYLQIDGKEVWFKLTGRFNAYNLLAVYAVARLLGHEKDQILTKLSLSHPPEGRFDRIHGKSGVIVIIDYAHTPDALANVLKTITEVRTGNESLITVVGCGGNRDKAKRPMMAAIAAQYSNKVILTSDNPRNEDPQTIIDEMKTGLDPSGKTKTIAIINRKEAIQVVIFMAKPGDIILIAGKGHEKYQEINGVKYPFDDRQITMEYLQ